MREKINKELLKLKDDKYKEFSINLLPGVSKKSVIGIRIPLLRKIAAETIKEPWWENFLQEDENLLFEEKMIQGMIIGLVKTEPEKKLTLIEMFLPRIDNWSICDSFCSGLKFAGEEKNQEKVWKFIEPLFSDKKEYKVRFASVMALNYYLKPEYLEEVLFHYDAVSHEGYYAKMAVAWGISVAYVKDPETTREFLKNNSLDKFTQNKSIQKIRESFRVEKADKELLKDFKQG